MWMHAPRVEDSAEVIGGFDVLSCGDQWRSAQPTGAGYCTIIARSSDNPGYDVDVKPRPAPRIRSTRWATAESHVTPDAAGEELGLVFPGRDSRLRPSSGRPF